MKKLLLILMLVTSSVFAKTYVINPDHSDITFAIKYMVLSEVPGTFKDFSGSFDFDPNSQRLSSIQLRIKVDSIFTNNKMRDGHLKKKDFFNVTQHPYITFKSEYIEKNDKQYTVSGQLSVKGISKTVILLVEYAGSQKDTWGKDSHFFSFFTDIKREDFNLTWNKTLDNGNYLLGEKVDIKGMIQAQEQGAKTAASKHMIPDNSQIRTREKVQRGEVDKSAIDTYEEAGAASVEMMAKTDLSEEGRPVNRKNEKAPIKGKESQLPLMILGFYGFIGACFMAYIVRVKLLKFLGDEGGSELSFSALASDFFGIVIIFVYAYAFYYFF